MDDLISRQAAIDAIYHHLPSVSRTRARTMLHEVPSAQPENQVHLCDSCRHVSPECPSEEDDVIYGNGKGNDNICACNKYEPSVQPERTCVNCGRTVNNGGWYADGRTRCPIEEHYALPKDGYCHLWEKRSVTDDDCPERREK